MRGKGHFRELAVAGALAAVLALVLPLQTYFANSSLYNFSLWRLLAECGIAALVVFLVTAMLQIAANRLVDGLLSVVFSAFLVCVYLESGPLAFGLPELNGTQAPELANGTRMIWDGAILVAAFMGIVAYFGKTKAFAHWMAIGSAVMAMAATFDIRRDTGISSDRGESNLHPQVAVLQSVRYSPVRNVLVFIVDSLTGPMCADIMRSDAELSKLYPGFVAFNNVGMSDCTKRGIPGIMTGRYFGPGTSSSEYPMSSYGEDSLLVPYLAADCPVYFVPDLLPYGCTNRKIGETPRPKGRQKRNWTVFMHRSNEVPYLSILDVVLFRTLPFAFKADFVYAKIRHDPMHERDESNFWHEHVMCSKLADALVSTEEKPALCVVHSWGAHMPRYFDDNGRPLPYPENSPNSVTAASRNALNKIGLLFARLREKGIYDKSTIVVCSDHANGSLPPVAPDRKSEEQALLWVKPENAKGKFTISDLPTSTSKIAPLVKASASRALSGAEIEKIVFTERRRFNGEWRHTFNLFHRGILFREWVIDAKGSVLETSEWKK